MSNPYNGTLYLFAHAPDFSSRHHPVERNQAFRVDRILSVDPASQIPWGILAFPTLSIRYQMSGALGTYQPRRANERELWRGPTGNRVEIETQEEYLFWFQQRSLQYGENMQISEPDWIVQIIKQRLQQTIANYH